jgi:hypothetical protein
MLKSLNSLWLPVSYLLYLGMVNLLFVRLKKTFVPDVVVMFN